MFQGGNIHRFFEAQLHRVTHIVFAWRGHHGKHGKHGKVRFRLNKAFAPSTSVRFPFGHEPSQLWGYQTI